MKRGKEIVQIVILMIKWDPRVSLERPVVQVDYACQTPALHTHYSWYDTVLMKELNVSPEEPDYQFKHWIIYSGRQDIFHYRRRQYHELTIIIASDKLYWFFTETDKPRDNKFASSYKDFSTHRCRCCAGNYFEYYVEEVHNKSALRLQQDML